MRQAEGAGGRRGLTRWTTTSTPVDDHALARAWPPGLAGIDGVQVEPPHQHRVCGPDRAGARQIRGLLPHLQRRASRPPASTGCALSRTWIVDAAGVDRAVAAIRQYFRA